MSKLSSGARCGAATDCRSGVCSNDICQAPACDDGVLNGEESDIDCGGSTCAGCSAGDRCGQADDCNSLVCTDNQCQAPRCDDQVQNGQETDRDCGGPCTDCTAGQGCSQNTDCDSDVCSDAICQAPSCEDGVLNGEEFGIDCGGECPSCSCVGDAVTDIAEVGNYPGDTTNAFSFEDATCAETGDSPESTFRFTPPEDGVFCAATVDADFDTVIYLREQCDDRATERRCNDSFDYPRESLGRLEFVGQADVPNLIVDGYGGQFSMYPTGHVYAGHHYRAM